MKFLFPSECIKYDVNHAPPKPNDYAGQLLIGINTITENGYRLNGMIHSPDFDDGFVFYFEESKKGYKYEIKGDKEVFEFVIKKKKAMQNVNVKDILDFYDQQYKNIHCSMLINHISASPIHFIAEEVKVKKNA